MLPKTQTLRVFRAHILSDEKLIKQRSLPFRGSPLATSACLGPSQKKAGQGRGSIQGVVAAQASVAHVVEQQE